MSGNLYNPADQEGSETITSGNIQVEVVAPPQATDSLLNKPPLVPIDHVPIQQQQEPAREAVPAQSGRGDGPSSPLPSSPLPCSSATPVEFFIDNDKPDTIVVKFNSSIKKTVIDQLEKLGWINTFKTNIGNNAQKESPPSKRQKGNPDDKVPTPQDAPTSTSEEPRPREIQLLDNPPIEKPARRRKPSGGSKPQKSRLEKIRAGKKPKPRPLIAPELSSSSDSSNSSSSESESSSDSDTSVSESLSTDSESGVARRKRLQQLHDLKKLQPQPRQDGRKKGQSNDAEFVKLLGAVLPMPRSLTVSLPSLNLDLHKRIEQVVGSVQEIEAKFNVTQHALIRFQEIKIAAMYLMYRMKGYNSVAVFMTERILDGEGVTTFLAKLDTTKIRTNNQFRSVRAGQCLILINQVLSPATTDMFKIQLIADVKSSQTIRADAYKWVVELTEPPNRNPLDKVLPEQFVRNYQKLVNDLRAKHSAIIKSFNLRNTNVPNSESEL